MVRNGSLAAATDSLTQLLTTFITSQSLQSQNYIVGFQSVRTDPANPTAGFKTHGLDLMQVYEPHHYIPRPEILEEIFKKEWSTHELLLEGARECAVSSLINNQDAYALPSIDPSTLQPICVSNLNLMVRESYDCTSGKIHAAESLAAEVKCRYDYQPFLVDRNLLGGETRREYFAARPESPVEQYLKSRGL